MFTWAEKNDEMQIGNIQKKINGTFVAKEESKYPYT